MRSEETEGMIQRKKSQQADDIMSSPGQRESSVYKLTETGMSGARQGLADKHPWPFRNVGFILLAMRVH